MKILVDENIPRMTVDHLRGVGHDVIDIRGTAGQGLPDPDLWILAIQEERMLITTDKGFTEHREDQHFAFARRRRPRKRSLHNG